MRTFALLMLLVVVATQAKPTRRHVETFAQRMAKAKMDAIHAGTDGKIVGGSPATPHEFPWQVSFQRSLTGFHFCGGSILNNRYIITAAHCVYGEDYNNPSNLQIVAGDQVLGQNEGTEQTIRVTRIVIHGSYNANNQYNDIALLYTASAITLNNNARAVSLPGNMELCSGTGTVTGWGTTSAGGSSSNTLLKVNVPFVSDASCRSSYSTAAIADSMICAGAAGRDSCQGDSGGPLVAVGTSKLCGVVSWGNSCADARWPGVYTETSHFITWINNNSR